MRKEASARGEAPRRPYRAVPGCLCCLPRAASSLPPLPRSLPATSGRRASSSTGGKRPARPRTAPANAGTAGGSGNPPSQPLPRGPYSLVAPSAATLSRRIVAQSGTPWPSAEGGSRSCGPGLSISLGSRDRAQLRNDLGTDLISLLAFGTCFLLSSPEAEGAIKAFRKSELERESSFWNPVGVFWLCSLRDN